MKMVTLKKNLITGIMLITICFSFAFFFQFIRMWLVLWENPNQWIPIGEPDRFIIITELIFFFIGIIGLLFLTKEVFKRYKYK